MPVKAFDLNEKLNPEQFNFFFSRNEINGYTGGYGNGKTAAACIRGINTAIYYEGARVLVGRATRPKLEDSTKKELLKWMPEEWIDRWPSERKNDLLIKNTGSTIEFRHVRQEGKGKGEEQSNLLSATYDHIIIDQFDDPEFTYKDFEDLFGRLRGTARYIGDDPTMPRVGPQFLDFTANPTRNWLFREVVGPYFLYKDKGFITQKLLYDKEAKKCIISVFNAPTRANSHITGKRYERRMQIVMRGIAGKRFIEGDWSAYEGLIYPDYGDTTHVVLSAEMREYITDLIVRGEVGILEGYDYGQASPSCYLLAFVDRFFNILIVDGFYQANYEIYKQAKAIKDIRKKWGIVVENPIYADPAIFRGRQATTKTIGKTVAELFQDEEILMRRGSNDIEAGIQKVTSYVAIDKGHKHPITGNIGAPRLFVSSDLEFVSNEFADYYWNRNTIGQNVDKPLDRNDHSMDTIKYMLSHQATVLGMIRSQVPKKLDPALFAFHEVDSVDSNELPRHRYG